MSETAGIALIILSISGSYLMYRWLNPTIKLMESDSGLDEKLHLFREMELEEMAKEKGIDLDTELVKRNARKNIFNKKSIRSELEQRMLDKYFPENTGEPK